MRLEAMTVPGFSFMVSVAFTLNYIMGTGFLTLPYAFYKTGIIIGISVLGVITFISILAAFFVLEAIARGQLIEETTKRMHMEYIEYQSMSLERMNSFGTQRLTSKSIKNDGNISDYIVGSLKIEIPELCELFLGIKGKLIYMVMISICMYGCLWCYATVFSNAFSTHLPINDYSYYIYLFIFSVIVIPLTCMELREQVTFQVILAIGRVIMILLMTSTVLIKLYNESNFIGYDSYSNRVNTFNIKYLYILLPLSMYANIFHHSIPALSEPVLKKSNLHYIYAVTLLFCFGAYTSISVLIALYFNEHVLPSSNLNWQNFHFYSNHINTSHTVRVIEKMVSFYIILFPAMDVASAFPLCGITLGNNLMSSIYGQNSMHYYEKSRYLRIYFRMLAAIPSLIGAIFVDNIDLITSFTGLSGFVIALIYPALLSIYSKKTLIGLNLSTETKYTNYLTSFPVCISIILFGLFSVIYIVNDMVISDDY
jgi:amino acid permease